MKTKLVKVQEEESILLVSEQEARNNTDYFKTVSEPITLEELANHCDMEAEQANYHDFVGVHRLLATLLYKEVGRIKAHAILLHIAEYGGLHNMHESKQAFIELGIEDCWGDWSL
jgi:hypothetical protein